MIYDLHIHTYNSSCSILKPKTILNIAKKIGLDGIAITDHNTIKGGIEVSKANKDKDFEVIPGIEVNTNRGHVLGLYVSQNINSRDFFEVVEDIKKQGGIAIIAHPFRLLPQLRSDIGGIDIKKYLDAVECYNARTSNFGNKNAIRFAEKNSLAKTGGSDSHFSFEIGRAVTVFDGELANAIQKGKTTARGSNLLGIFGSTFSFFYKRIFRRW